MSEYGYFSAKEAPNVVAVKHRKIQRDIFNVLLCSVFSRNVLLDNFWDQLSIVPRRSCTAFSRTVLIISLAGTGIKLFYTDSWVWHAWVGQWQKPSYSKRYVDLQLVLFSAACNWAEKMRLLYGLSAKKIGWAACNGGLGIYWRPRRQTLTANISTVYLLTYLLTYFLVLWRWQLSRHAQAAARGTLRDDVCPPIHPDKSEMDVGPFFFTQPNPSTYGPNPTHLSHNYVKCRHQHCRTHIFTCPLMK